MNPLSGLEKGRRDTDDEDYPSHVENSLKPCSRKSELISTTTIHDLPDGLLVEIFVRLRVIFANQCKSVSKRWRSLLSTPWFVRSYVRRQITFSTSDGTSSPPLSLPPFTFISEYPAVENKEEFRLRSSPNMFAPYFLSFLPYYNSDKTRSYVARVVAASNDLLLCRSTFWVGELYVCNPFTRRWVKIPHAAQLYEYLVIGFVCNPFYKVVDDEKKNGYQVIDTPYRYKIVKVRCILRSPSKSSYLDIFSSETGKWSTLTISCPQFLHVVHTLRCSCSSGFLSNRRLYWMCGTQHIFAYDPFKGENNNIVEVIDRPVELRGAEDVQLGACKGRLRLLKFYGDSMFMVWELEDYSRGKWCKVCEISVGAASNPIVNQIAIAFDPYDENIVYMWFPSVVISCNMRSGLLKDEITHSKNIHHVIGKVFVVFQPCCPTPVSASLLPLT